MTSLTVTPPLVVSSIILFASWEPRVNRRKMKRGQMRSSCKIQTSPKWSTFLPFCWSRRYREPGVSPSHWWSWWRRPCHWQSQWAAQDQKSLPASAGNGGAHLSVLWELSNKRSFRPQLKNMSLSGMHWLEMPTNVALWGVTLTPHHRGVTLHQAHDSGEVSLVDDSAVVRRALGVSSVKFLEGDLKKKVQIWPSSFTQWGDSSRRGGVTSSVRLMHSITRLWMQGSHRM